MRVASFLSGGFITEKNAPLCSVCFVSFVIDIQLVETIFHINIGDHYV